MYEVRKRRPFNPYTHTWTIISSETVTVIWEVGFCGCLDLNGMSNLKLTEDVHPDLNGCMDCGDDQSSGEKRSCYPKGNGFWVQNGKYYLHKT